MAQDKKPKRDRRDVLKKIVDALKQWDNTASAESRGSVVFSAWWQRFGQQGTGVGADAYAAPWTPDQPMATPHGIGNKRRAVEVFLLERVEVAGGGLEQERLGRRDRGGANADLSDETGPDRRTAACCRPAGSPLPAP